jgi:hypothetical protein
MPGSRRPRRVHGVGGRQDARQRRDGGLRRGIARHSMLMVRAV